MSEHTYTDSETNLIINRLNRAAYDDLMLSGLVQQDQLYLIDDDNFDVFNKRVINVNQPEAAGDAVNLDYLSSEYINKDDIIDFVDNSKIYSSRLEQHWPNGSTYIKGDRTVYTKDTARWDITVIQGSVAASDIAVVYTGTFGWQFNVGSVNFGQNFTTYPDSLHETTTYSGATLEVSATAWHQTDTLVGRTEIYSCLSGLTDASELSDIRTALIGLKQKLSA